MSSEAPTARSWPDYAVLSVILLVALWLRLYGVAAGPLWYDELYSLLDTAARQQELESLPRGVVIRDLSRLTDLPERVGVLDAWQGMRQETHPPLYFAFLHVWRRVAGDSEAAVRVPSAVFSALCVVPVYLLVRRVGSKTQAAWAALLLAAAYSAVQIGQEARQYALALLLICLAFWQFAELEATATAGRGRRIVTTIAYALCVLAAMLTHYFALFPLAAQGLVALWRLRGRQLLTWLAATGCATLAFLAVWFPNFLAQQTHIQAQSWLVEAGEGHTRDTMMRAASLPFRQLFDWHGRPVGGISAAAGVALLLLMAWGVVRNRTRATTLALWWFVLPAAAVSVIDLATQRSMLAHLRFVCFAVPGLAILTAQALGSLPRIARHVAPAVLTAVVVLSLRYPLAVRPDAWQAASVLDHEVQERDIVLFDGVGAPKYWSQMLLLLCNHYTTQPLPAVMLLDEPPDPATWALLDPFHRVFLFQGLPGKPSLELPAGFEPVEGTPEILIGMGRLVAYGRSTGDESDAPQPSSPSGADSVPHRP